MGSCRRTNVGVDEASCHGTGVDVADCITVTATRSRRGTLAAGRQRVSGCDLRRYPRLTRRRDPTDTVVNLNRIRVRYCASGERRCAAALDGRRGYGGVRVPCTDPVACESAELDNEDVQVFRISTCEHISDMLE